MRNRARVLFLTFAGIAAASFLRAQCATIPPGGGMLGPNPANGDAPAFMDSDGSGGPSCGDIPIVPQMDADTITIPNPYQNCDGSNNNDNSFHLVRDKGGVPIQLYRDREPNETEILTPTAFFAPNQPMSGHLEIQRAGMTVQAGDGMLLSSGGFFGGGSGMQTFGGSTSATMSFVYQGNGGGGAPAYISLPWSQMASLGLLNTKCSTPVPQVFVPLSNGRIVLDLDGDGVPDPGLFSSPPLARQGAGGFGIPTVSRGMMVLLAAALVGVGLFQLRRGGLGF